MNKSNNPNDNRIQIFIKKRYIVTPAGNGLYIQLLKKGTDRIIEAITGDIIEISKGKTFIIRSDTKKYEVYFSNGMLEHHVGRGYLKEIDE